MSLLDRNQKIHPYQPCEWLSMFYCHLIRESSNYKVCSSTHHQSIDRHQRSSSDASSSRFLQNIRKVSFLCFRCCTSPTDYHYFLLQRYLSTSPSSRPRGWSRLDMFDGIWRHNEAQLSHLLQQRFCPFWRLNIMFDFSGKAINSIKVIKNIIS